MYRILITTEFLNTPGRPVPGSRNIGKPNKMLSRHEDDDKDTNMARRIRPMSGSTDI
jgi:hypothetical protein